MVTVIMFFRKSQASQEIIEQDSETTMQRGLTRALVVQPLRRLDWWKPAYLRPKQNPKQRRVMLRLVDNRDETIAEI